MQTSKRSAMVEQFTGRPFRSMSVIIAKRSMATRLVVRLDACFGEDGFDLFEVEAAGLSLALLPMTKGLDADAPAFCGFVLAEFEVVSCRKEATANFSLFRRHGLGMVIPVGDMVLISSRGYVFGRPAVFVAPRPTFTKLLLHGVYVNGTLW